MHGTPKVKIIINLNFNKNIRDKSFVHEVQHYFDYMECINKYVDEANEFEGRTCRCGDTKDYLAAYHVYMIAKFNVMNIEFDFSDYPPKVVARYRKSMDNAKNDVYVRLQRAKEEYEKKRKILLGY